jgi:hypothetical protein
MALCKACLPDWSGQSHILSHILDRAETITSPLYITLLILSKIPYVQALDTVHMRYVTLAYYHVANNVSQRLAFKCP